MADTAPFLQGLKLGRMLYEEAGRRIVEAVVAADSYAAALVGRGSDVLGFDTGRSIDHDWGPRFQVFLLGNQSADQFDNTSARLDQELREHLPPVFHGCAVDYPDADGARVAHHVEITTLRGWLRRYLSIEETSRLSDLDWLTFPEQRLVEVTSGEIFHDPRGELSRVRESLREYPRDVWLYRMACQWQRLSQEEAFVGRCAEVGDRVGMKIVAARIVKDAIKLCFLVERRYAPYDKWLATALRRLACGPGMGPLFSAALDASTYPALEPSLVEIYRRLGEMHNGLDVTGPMDPAPRQYFSRPYTVMRSDRFANALLRAVKSEELLRIPVRMGGIDQLIDNTDFIENPSVYRRVLELYRGA
jgi:hypothetical protein